MRSLLHLVAGVVLALPACSVAIGQHITTPSEHLGRPLGADFELADWNEVSSYYRKLGDESPNVLTLKAGETTEGRDFLITIISSQEAKAVETGEIVAAELGIRCQSKEGLREHDRSNVEFFHDQDRWHGAVARFFDEPEYGGGAGWLLR